MIKAWRDKLEQLLLEKDYKDIMLLNLLYLSIGYFFLTSSAALILQYYQYFIVKFIATIALYATLRYYQKTSKTKISALFLIIIIEIEIASDIIGGSFFEFITLSPFLSIAGFFFFFNFRAALIATFLHYSYWLVVFFYSYHYVYPAHPIFTYSLISNQFNVSFFILAFSISYYFSTTVIYKKTQKALYFKENILKEIYHRINNNLNLMASILGLQINQAKLNPPKSYQEILKTSRLRIDSIATTHEVLYETHDVKKVDFEKYVKKLTNLITKTYERDVDIDLICNKLKLDSSLINKLGIIINELLTNTIKHSKDEKLPKITISLKIENANYHFSYHEKNGQNIDMNQLENSKTLGMRLIQLTVEDIQGEMKVFWDDGLWVEIVIYLKQ